MNSVRRCATSLAIFIARLAPIAPAQDFNLTVGKHEVMQSKILGEKRDILVSVPRRQKPNMPLLVVLDGEWTFTKVAVIVDHLVGNGRLPPMVVAGIVNTDRGRDFTPTFEGAEFAAGPSDRFLSFIADELIPQLASEYPIGKYHILAGHSNGGMFSLYAFIRRPDVFQANIALSPSFGLDDRFVALLGRAIAKPNASPRFVFIGAGGDEEADISVGALRFAKTFESSPNADLEYHYEDLSGRNPRFRWPARLLSRPRIPRRARCPCLLRSCPLPQRGAAPPSCMGPALWLRFRRRQAARSSPWRVPLLDALSLRPTRISLRSGSDCRPSMPTTFASIPSSART